MPGRGEEFAQRVIEASTPRLPGLLLRDTYAAYDSILGVHVDELRLALESERGTHDAS